MRTVGSFAGLLFFGRTFHIRWMFVLFIMFVGMYSWFVGMYSWFVGMYSWFVGMYSWFVGMYSWFVYNKFLYTNHSILSYKSIT